MSDLLVPRVRRRRVPQALQVDGARRVARVPRRSPCGSSSSRSSSGADYRAIAHENIIRRVTLATTRGVIRDANGEVLAVEPARVQRLRRPRPRDAERPPSASRCGRRDRLVAQHRRLAAREPRGARAFEERIRTACATDEDKSPCWRPILVREDLPRDVVAELLQHESELPGVDVVERPGPLLSVQGARRAPARLRGRDRRRDARRGSVPRATISSPPKSGRS